MVGEGVQAARSRRHLHKALPASLSRERSLNKGRNIIDTQIVENHPQCEFNVSACTYGNKDVRTLLFVRVSVFHTVTGLKDAHAIPTQKTPKEGLLNLNRVNTPRRNGLCARAE